MRPRTRNLLLLAAVLATAGVALLLLRDGGTPDPAPGNPGTVPTARAGAVPGAPSPPRNPPAARGPAADPAVPEGPRLDLRAVVGGEWGLAGVQVLPVERFRDGSLVAMIGDDAPDGGETDGDGRITLRYKAEPAERLFGVLPDAAEFESAENAGAAGEIPPFRVFRAASPGPVTLRFRDPEGTALLRPVDGRTGEILSGRPGIRVAWTIQVAGEEPECEIEEPSERFPGWLRVAESGDPQIRDVRLLVPGYLPSPAPTGGWKGRVLLPLKADPGAVRGRILVPEGWTAWAVLRGAADGLPCAAAGLSGVPDVPGAFAMGGVPAGEWDLVVQAAGGERPAEEVSWVVRRFDFRGTGLDLGDLRPLPGSVLRACLVSREGKPVASADLLLSRCIPGMTPLLSYNRDSRKTVCVSWPGQGEEPWWSEKRAGDEGWVVFRGLQPGASYLLATPLVPGLIRAVAAPANPGEVLTVELDGGCALTTCVLHFTVEGEEPSFWSGFSGPAYGDQFSTGKGILEAGIPPGRYRIAAMAAPGPEPDFGFYEAEVEIPDSGRYEATVDLKIDSKARVEK